ncbi:MAG: 4'-phosphopantetheinyl transferase superfamily protein [Saprospiraceae bacterium]
MPVKNKIQNEENFELAIWDVVESIDYFESKLDIHNEEIVIITELSSRKKVEWLSSRYLLHIMSGRSIRGEFVKDNHGKPHLIDSQYHVSISHSRDKVAVIASPSIVGIDIQYFVNKIGRIQHKFVSEYEAKMIAADQEIEYLHIIWGAKEALYKCYGKRGLDFKKHIKINHFKIEETSGSFIGTVIKDDYNMRFDISYVLYNQYILVYAKESI